MVINLVAIGLFLFSLSYLYGLRCLTFCFVHLHLIQGISHTHTCPSGPINVLLSIPSSFS
jgi:hypothetical protein